MQKRSISALEERIAFLLFFFDSDYFSRALFIKLQITIDLHETTRIYTNHFVSDSCPFVDKNYPRIITNLH